MNLEHNHMENPMIEVSEDGVVGVHGEIGHGDFIQRISIGIMMLDEFVRASRKWARRAEPEAKFPPRG